MKSMLRSAVAHFAQRRMVRVLIAMSMVPLVFAGCASLGVKSAYLDAAETGTTFPTTVPPNTQIYTKVAGVAFSLDVLAGVYMTNNTTIQSSVNAGFPYGTVYAEGQSYIDFVDLTKSGGSCGTVGDANQVSGVTNGTAGVGAYGGGNSLSYNWSGAEHGRKTYTFTAAQAVAKAKVRIYGNNSSQGVSTTSCSMDTFTIRPAGLTLSSTPASGATQAAGSNYTMTATAVNNGGTTTTAYTGTPALTTTTMTDWRGFLLSLGSFSGSFGAAVSGVSSGSSFNYSDFGPLTIPAGAVTDSTYVANSGSGDVAGLDCISGSASNVKVGGLYGCNFANTASATTPSFIAHHYSATHAITPACNSQFTYFGQPLTYAVTIDAFNALGNRMTRLTSSAPNKPTFTFSQLNSGAATINPLTIPALTWASDLTYGTASGGEYALSATSVASTRPAGLSSVSASPPSYESFRVRVTSSDANITTCNGVAAAGTTSCDSAATKLRYGVLQLSDGQSTSASPASMRITAQYWNGSAFVTNTNDVCTALNFNAGTIASSVLPRPTAKNTSTTLSNGVGAVMLSSTVASNVAIRLGGSDNNCVTATSGVGVPLNAVSSYLGSTSCSASYDKDPSARMTFGTLRSPYIYRAEKF